MTNMDEDTWGGMANAIIGSGSYALRGDDQRQVDILVRWLRDGANQGYNWRGTYQRIYDYWATWRPLLPPPPEMERLVTVGAGT